MNAVNKVLFASAAIAGPRAATALSRKAIRHSAIQQSAIQNSAIQKNRAIRQGLVRSMAGIAAPPI